jgi:hypothetical protein
MSLLPFGMEGGVPRRTGVALGTNPFLQAGEGVSGRSSC